MGLVKRKSRAAAQFPRCKSVARVRLTLRSMFLQLELDLRRIRKSSGAGGKFAARWEKVALGRIVLGGRLRLQAGSWRQRWRASRRAADEIARAAGLATEFTREFDSSFETGRQARRTSRRLHTKPASYWSLIESIDLIRLHLGHVALSSIHILSLQPPTRLFTQ